MDIKSKRVGTFKQFLKEQSVKKINEARVSAYSHDIDPHSYDVDPLEEGMAFKEQSLFACKQAVVQLYKDITFSFSWTLHRE